MAKLSKSISEQITILQDRDLQFRNISNASHILNNISYYRLKGYWWELQDNNENHHFAPNSYFEDVIDLYNFDRHFRMILFNAIERIEISLRTKMIYHLSLGYGAHWYFNPSIFQDPKRHIASLEKINTDIINSREEFIIKHFENHPNEMPESWKALENFSYSFGNYLYE